MADKAIIQAIIRKELETKTEIEHNKNDITNMLRRHKQAEFATNAVWCYNLHLVVEKIVRNNQRNPSEIGVIRFTEVGGIFYSIVDEASTEPIIFTCQVDKIKRFICKYIKQDWELVFPYYLPISKGKKIKNT